MRSFIGGAAFGAVLVLTTVFCMPVAVVQTAGADGFSYEEAQGWENDRARIVEAARRAIALSSKGESVARLVEMHRKTEGAQSQLESKMTDARCDAAFRWLRTDHSMKFGASKALAGELMSRGYRYDQQARRWAQQQGEKK